MRNRKYALLAIIAGGLVVIGSAVAQHRPSSSPDLSGNWTLNRELSKDPEVKYDHLHSAQGGHNPASHGHGSAPTADETALMEHAHTLLSSLSSSLVIKQEGNTVEVRSANGGEQILTADGRKQTQSGRSVTTKWEKQRLVSETAAGKAKITETFERATGKAGLIVTVKMKMAGQDLSIRRVYDPADAPSSASSSSELRGEALLNALRGGGYTILLRHARTDYSTVDATEDTRFVTERSKQRNLSAAGVADAKAIGSVIRDAGIPIGEILASPLYRTRETAQLAFGEPTVAQELRGMESSPEQRSVITKAPQAGTNRVLVTHHFVIERYTPGIKLGEVGESEAVVLRTSSDGTVTLAGRFTLADWQRLSGGKTGDVNIPQGQRPPGHQRPPHALPGNN